MDEYENMECQEKGNTPIIARTLDLWWHWAEVEGMAPHGVLVIIFPGCACAEEVYAVRAQEGGDSRRPSFLDALPPEKRMPLAIKRSASLGGHRRWSTTGVYCGR